MRVRCGACRSEVEIPGPGRFTCPACGSPNEVRAPGAGGMPPPGAGPMGAPPPPPPPDPPSPKVTCEACGFSFIVGDIEVAVCPNCGVEVAVREGSEE